MFTMASVTDRVVVSDFLATRNWIVPRLLKTRDGEWCTDDGSGRLVIAYPFIPGQTINDEQVLTEDQCAATGRLLRRWHQDLKELQYKPLFRIENFRDVENHARILESNLSSLNPKYRVLGELVVMALTALETLPCDSVQLIHGDPKVANYLYDASREPFSLLDFDTVMIGSVYTDIGDLLRSMSSADVVDSFSGTRRREAVLRGYWGGDTADSGYHAFAERALLGQCLVSLDRCAMLLIDIVEGSYFKWDPSKYSSHAEHNFHKASVQWEIYMKQFGGLK
jgi:Ser/Thr protein kinase RdoA (MazF antagonist)